MLLVCILIVTMHGKLKQRIKAIALDTLGVLMIIAAPLIGWLPGPGGIPLLLGGLGLLSINHKWARRLLDDLKTRGLNLVERFYVDHPLVRAVYDLLSALLIGTGIYFFANVTGSLVFGLGIVSFFTGLALFLGNRKRLERLNKRLRRK